MARTLGELLETHIADDHLSHEETNKKLEKLLGRFQTIDDIGKGLRRWIVGTLSGLIVALCALGVQNWLLHQQADATANQAASAVKNTITPAEQAILEKLNVLQNRR